MTAAFVFELIRAANETDRLTKPERARLLERAANTIRDYRDEIAISGAPANSQPGDIEHELREVARLIDMFTAEEVSAQILEAARVIKDLRVILDCKHEVLKDGGTGERE